LEQIIAGMNNQSSMINEKLGEIILALSHEASLINSNPQLEQLIAGINNQSSMINDKFAEIILGLNHQSALINGKSEEIILGIRNLSALINDNFNAHNGTRRALLLDDDEAASTPDTLQGPPPAASKHDFQEAMQRIPLLLAEKTYNTSHPDYDATLVRNDPGRIFNADVPCRNRVFAELKTRAIGDRVPDETWNLLLSEALQEAKTVPHAAQVFERRSFIESYMAELSRKYQAYYQPGWVNLDDALFLYWLVRRAKPRHIVQTGVCNGLSSAFMMLALVKNGPEGTLHVIDLPAVFSPNDPDWTVKDKVYGVVIPEGKSSGWMVPDAYHDRLEVRIGDAKDLLPKLIDQLPAIDMFYHDSDHTYRHMMFEFTEAKRKLAAGGLIVGDDISWNASVWDFADRHSVPSYNFKGSVGVAFF
jgi:predicted O-methyltransferase YrrM